MYLPSTKEIIEQMKAEKSKHRYSVPGIQRMCEREGLYICLNTFRNIFARGSENSSFSYERTLRPIANVLIPHNNKLSDTDIMEKELALLTGQLQAERELSRRRIDSLNTQIAYLTGKLAEKDKLIKELMEKCLQEGKT